MLRFISQLVCIVKLHIFFLLCCNPTPRILPSSNAQYLLKERVCIKQWEYLYNKNNQHRLYEEARNGCRQSVGNRVPKGPKPFSN